MISFFPIPHNAMNLFTMVFALSMLSAFRVDASFESEATIAQNIILRVGSVEVSRYAFEKNLERIRQHAEGGGIAAEALGGYLAKQVIIAEALNRGYAKRPEVVRLVESMERQILVQSEVIAATAEVAEMREIYGRSPIHFGEPKQSDKPSHFQLEQLVPAQKRHIARQRLRQRILDRVSLTFVSEVADKLIQGIQAQSSIRAEITDAMIAHIASEAIASYWDNGARISITVDAWQKQFNHSFVRALPKDAMQLEVQIQEWLVTEFASREARQRGTDREPQFIEDRRNFLYYQVLDLFEKEQLHSMIRVSAEEIKAHYLANPSEYSRPFRAHGILHKFDNEGQAVTWLRSKARDARAGRDVVVSKESPIPGAEDATEHILRMPTGAQIGPLHTKDGLAVFVKLNTELGIRPYLDVVDAIQAKLLRSKLDALEFKLADEWASRFEIRDCIEAKELGIKGEIRKPWN